ncbi:MAG TPA: DinB family protein [Thermomicrobiales bacterium]|nr:DinB family protein [Thermomicrobiales bacterium]
MADAMKTPTNKAELLTFMQTKWDGLVRASDALPDEVWLGPVDAAGWNVRDHAGHVTAWQKAEMPLLSTGTPIPETTGMPAALWDAGDTDAINEWYRQSIVTMSPAEVRAERDRVFPRLVEVVSAIPEEDLLAPARERGLEDSERSLLTVMSENYGLHFDDHRAQIEALGKAAASS